jgi:tetratricopeptide (TPR) repeat protein
MNNITLILRLFLAFIVTLSCFETAFAEKKSKSKNKYQIQNLRSPKVNGKNILSPSPLNADDPQFEDFLSSDKIIQEIERNLLFDNESRSRVKFHQQDEVKKSTFALGLAKEGTANAKSNKENKASVEVFVADAKQSYELKEKEKFAYNASLTGQYEVAIALYKEVLAKNPTNADVKFALAITYQNLRQYQQAKKIYYQLLKSNPENNQEIVSNLLTIVIEENPRDASRILSKLSVQNPQSAQIIAHGAIAFEKIKDYDQAIYLLKRAIQIDPIKFEYRYNLAILYDLNHNYDKAITAYLQLIDEIDKIGDVEYVEELEQLTSRVAYLQHDTGH